MRNGGVVETKWNKAQVDLQRKRNYKTLSREGKDTAIERKKTTVGKLTSKIYQLKLRIQELRIERGDNDDEIGKWLNEMDLELERFDREMDDVKQTTGNWEKEEQKRTRIAGRKTSNQITPG